MTRTLSLLSTALFLIFASMPAASSAKDRGGDLSCDDTWRDGDRATFCEIREVKLTSFGGRLDVDPGMNGGVAVNGWDSNEVLVRYKIQAQADTDDAARALAGQITVDTAGGRVRTSGPTRDLSWGVTFLIFVPNRTDVTVKTTNGGVALADLSGRIQFEALNGGVALRGLAGHVEGRTTNGGLAVALSGDRWDGEGMDVSTVNGGVSVTIPTNYSARFETGTVHGGLSLDVPMTIQGKISKRIETTLGSGGPLVRVTTTNGGVRVQNAE